MNGKISKRRMWKAYLLPGNKAIEKQLRLKIEEKCQIEFFRKI
jgi:hypothetical protein